MLEALQDFAAWLIDTLLWIPRQLWNQLLEGLAELLNSIPIPDFVDNIAPAAGGITAEVMFWATFLEVQYGLTVILAATLVRFLIRRIPIIG